MNTVVHNNDTEWTDDVEYDRQYAPHICNIDRLQWVDDATTSSYFLQHYWEQKPVVLLNATDNSYFRQLCTKQNLIASYGSLTMVLSSANTHSYNKINSSLKSYVTNMMGPQPIDTDGISTFYLFGDHNFSELSPLFIYYNRPFIPTSARRYGLNTSNPCSSSSSSSSSHEQLQSQLETTTQTTVGNSSAPTPVPPMTSPSISDADDDSHFDGLSWGLAGEGYHLCLYIMLYFYFLFILIFLCSISICCCCDCKIMLEKKLQLQQPPQPLQSLTPLPLGSMTGVPFHTHGAVYAEVIHGRKVSTQFWIVCFG